MTRSKIIKLSQIMKRFQRIKLNLQIIQIILQQISQHLLIKQNLKIILIQQPIIQARKMIRQVTMILKQMIHKLLIKHQTPRKI